MQYTVYNVYNRAAALDEVGVPITFRYLHSIFLSILEYVG